MHPRASQYRNASFAISSWAGSLTDPAAAAAVSAGAGVSAAGMVRVVRPFAAGARRGAAPVAVTLMSDSLEAFLAM